MDGEAVNAASAAEAAPEAAPLPAADLPPAGSPEDREPTPELRTPSDEDDPDREQDAEQDSGAAVLTGDDLKQRIIKQVEYYFSDENLPTDKYMLNVIKKNKEGFVPIGIIASFRKMKKLSRDHAFISAALKESAFLVVSPDAKRVKRLNPLPASEVPDYKLFTVLVEKLPEDHSVENLRKVFGEVGRIKKITIHDPIATEETKKSNKILYSTKVHALVEYEAAKAAEKAATTLNNVEDWRYGMRVKLLKEVGMYGQRKPARTKPESDKKTNSRLSDHIGDGENNSNEHHDHHEDTPDEQDGEHGANGGRGRSHGNQGRGRKQRHRGPIGHGHGTVASAHVTEVSKPPPGPKMPDGTRGFTLGRGRPPSCDRN